MFKEGFKPSYAAFTFPTAIAALVAFKLSVYCEAQGLHVLISIFGMLGDTEILIATYVVFFY